MTATGDALAAVVRAAGATLVVGTPAALRTLATGTTVDEGVRLVSLPSAGAALAAATGFAGLTDRPAVAVVDEVEEPAVEAGWVEAVAAGAPVVVVSHSDISAGADRLPVAGAARRGPVLWVPGDPVPMSREDLWPSVDHPPAPDPDAVAVAAGALTRARRPVFIGGRGGRAEGARLAIEALAERTGALLATSLAARGLYGRDKHPWHLGVVGTYGTPLSAEYLSDADVVVAWGCSLSPHTTQRGRLLDPDATVIRVDDHPAAVAGNRVDMVVHGDVEAVARAVTIDLAQRSGTGAGVGYRTADVADRIARQAQWNKRPYDDTSGDGRIDPRLLTIALNRLISRDRVLVVGPGPLAAYPAGFFEIPDEQGFLVLDRLDERPLGPAGPADDGSGPVTPDATGADRASLSPSPHPVAAAIGAALARPDRMPVVALTPTDLERSVDELEAAAALSMPLAVVVYAEPGDAEGGRSGDAARARPLEVVTVGSIVDLDGVASWAYRPPTAPLVIEALVTDPRPAHWKVAAGPC